MYDKLYDINTELFEYIIELSTENILDVVIRYISHCYTINSDDHINYKYMKSGCLPLLEVLLNKISANRENFSQKLINDFVHLIKDYIKYLMCGEKTIIGNLLRNKIEILQKFLHSIAIDTFNVIH
jgi:hypothetical protein